MPLYIYSSALLQTLLALVDLSFFFLYGALILCCSIVDSRATQSAYLFSSVAGIYETLMGESKRFFLRRNVKPQEQLGLSHGSPQVSPTGSFDLSSNKAMDTKSSLIASDKKNNHITSTSSNPTNTKLEVVDTTQQVPYQSPEYMTRGVSVGLFLVFWVCLFVANYVSALVNIGLGYASKPTPNLLSKNIAGTSELFPQWYFDLSGPNKTSSPANVFYDVHAGYNDADQYNWSHTDDYFNDTLNAQTQLLLGTSVFQNHSFTCSLLDDAAGYILDAGPVALSIMKTRAFAPSLACSMITNGIGSAYLANPMLQDTPKMDLKYSDGYGSQIFIGDNVTLFAVDRANRTTTAMTLTVVDHQLSSLEYDTNDVDQIWSMYDKWLTGLLTDTGIPLPGANDSFYSQSQSLTFQGEYYLSRDFGTMINFMKLAISKKMSFVSIFTRQKKMRAGYYKNIRFIVNVDNTLYNNQRQMTASVLNYTTETVRYNINPKYPTTYHPDTPYVDDFPLTMFYSTNLTLKYPVLFTQPIVNVKSLPIAASGLAKFANYTMADPEIMNMTYGNPVGFKYNVIIIVAVIVIIAGLAFVIFASSWTFKGGRFVRIPQYYDLLHEHFQNGKNCTSSIFTISQPLYTGHAFLKDRDANYLGIMNSVYLRDKPRKAYPYI